MPITAELAGDRRCQVLGVVEEWRASRRSSQIDRYACALFAGRVREDHEVEEQPAPERIDIDDAWVR